MERGGTGWGVRRGGRTARAGQGRAEQSEEEARKVERGEEGGGGRRGGRVKRTFRAPIQKQGSFFQEVFGDVGQFFDLVGHGGGVCLCLVLGLRKG